MRIDAAEGDSAPCCEHGNKARHIIKRYYIEPYNSGKAVDLIMKLVEKWYKSEKGRIEK